MLCGIHHIKEDISDILSLNDRKYVNNVVKTLFADLSEEVLHESFDTFWSEYTNLNHNIGPFVSNEFILSSKDIFDGNIHMWHQK